jgi:hypothetical protein
VVILVGGGGCKVEEGQPPQLIIRYDPGYAATLLPCHFFQLPLIIKPAKLLQSRFKPLPRTQGSVNTA